MAANETIRVLAQRLVAQVVMKEQAATVTLHGV
jgi:hypothetical protein